MQYVIKAILADASARNQAALPALVAASASAGDPWTK